MKNSWPQYAYGHCLQCSNNHDYAYINIPKNASSWMSGTFPDALSTTYYQIKNPDIKFIVVLREPLDRWVSAAAQSLTGFLDDDIEDALTDLCKKIVIDDHTVPQSCYIENVDHDRIIWFDMHENLKELTTIFAKQELDVEPGDHDIGHPGENYYNIAQGRQKDIKEHVSNLVNSNPDLKQKLVDFYKDDIALYNSQTFYNGGSVDDYLLSKIG